MCNHKSLTFSCPRVSLKLHLKKKDLNQFAFKNFIIFKRPFSNQIGWNTINQDFARALLTFSAAPLLHILLTGPRASRSRSETRWSAVTTALYTPPSRKSPWKWEQHVVGGSGDVGGGDWRARECGRHSKIFFHSEPTAGRGPALSWPMWFVCSSSQSHITVVQPV